MATNLPPEVVRAIENDPELVSLYTTPRSSFFSDKSSTDAAFARVLARHGITNPQDFELHTKNGLPQLDERGFLDKHGTTIAKIATAAAPMAFGGAALAPALFGGGAAAGGGTAATAAGTTAGTTAGAGTVAGTAAGGGSILSTLGKWYDRGAGAIDRIGQTATGMAKGAAEGRLAESSDQFRRDALNQNAAEGNVKADSLRLRQAILANMLGGSQDASVTAPSYIASRIGHVSGGLRPSAIPDRQAISSSIMPRLMASLKTGNEIPRPAPAPQEGVLDKINSGIGTASGYLQSVLPYVLNRPKPAVAAPGPITGTMPKVRF